LAPVGGVRGTDIARRNRNRRGVTFGEMHHLDPQPTPPTGSSDTVREGTLKVAQVRAIETGRPAAHLDSHAAADLGEVDRSPCAHSPPAVVAAEPNSLYALWQTGPIYRESRSTRVRRRHPDVPGIAQPGMTSEQDRIDDDVIGCTLIEAAAHENDANSGLFQSHGRRRSAKQLTC